MTEEQAAEAIARAFRDSPRKTMTEPLDLEAVGKRSVLARTSSNPKHQADSSADVPALIAEVKRLREAEKHWDAANTRNIAVGMRDKDDAFRAQQRAAELEQAGDALSALLHDAPFDTPADAQSRYESLLRWQELRAGHSLAKGENE